MDHIVLPDGRRLAWADYGDRSGRPLVALHGSPDSHAIWKLADAAAKEVGVRIVAPDRPGFGESDPQPGRRILDWVDDHVALVDHLGIERHAVITISGGSPYATAVAWARPDLVERLGLLSVIAPLHAPGVLEGTNREIRFTFRTARRAPFLLPAMARLMVRVARRNPDKALEMMTNTRPPADREIIERPETMAVARENLTGQFHHAPSIAREMRLAARDWGFPLDEIAVPTIIWVGGQDDVHPPAMARHLRDAIPGARLELEPAYATFNFLDDAARVLTELIG